MVAWIAANCLAIANRWDPYPFILLNLMFSLQAAYAAPLILPAQTRQAEREKLLNDADREQRESIAQATLTNQAEALALIRQLSDRLDPSDKLLRTITSPEGQTDQ